jgi:hypothetical protein
LGFQLALPDLGESHQIFTHDEIDYVILSGFWIAPQARSIFQRHQIDGLILVTTFKVMNKYHTAILMVVSHNVGLPVAISFGPRESFELSNRFDTIFRDAFQIDLTQYVLESDQGSALKKVGLQHARHLFCLRHVLKSLHHKGGRFAGPVGNLISARLMKELEVFVNTYTLPFIQVYRSDGPEKAQMIRCLKKVGLVFNGISIRYAEPHRARWRQVSMLERFDTKMPTTSNTIECLNGHLNERTPRFNTFWGSLHRLRELIIQRIDNFHNCLVHNMRYEQRKARRRCRCLPAARMRRELGFFCTTSDQWRCGETRFACELYRADIPCSHRLALCA